jgi:hypothetical protein
MAEPIAEELPEFILESVSDFMVLPSKNGANPSIGKASPGKLVNHRPLRSLRPSGQCCSSSSVCCAWWEPVCRSQIRIGRASCHRSSISWRFRLAGCLRSSVPGSAVLWPQWLVCLVFLPGYLEQAVRQAVVVVLTSRVGDRGGAGRARPVPGHRVVHESLFRCGAL